MQILVIGSGGREHALCLAFSRSSRVSKVFCADGNAGIAEAAEIVPIKPVEVEKLADFAVLRQIDITFIGGETALALGIVDVFERRGLRVIGPTAAAARLESSKAFAKQFMARNTVPTAMSMTANTVEEAIAELNSGRFGGPESPVVVKADGLAAGKGVVVAQNRSDAVEAIIEMAGRVGTVAASTIVLEECLFGREVSLIMFADGEDFALMPPTRDHKRIGDGDSGPNTGGMGTITDESLLSDDELTIIISDMIRPTLKGCVSEGFAFKGVLFLGLMITATGPKLLEYNVRFGDPETQSILARLDSDIVDICDAMLAGDLRETNIKWKDGNSACVILAAEDYPEKPRTGDVILGIEKAAARKGITVYHSGTARDENGELVTAGGRVLGITAAGNNLETCLGLAYQAVGDISWPGMQYRRDIGVPAKG